MELKNFIFHDLTSVSENTTIKQLLKVMVYNHISAVPVVNEKNDYVGCISESDIFEAATPAYMKLMPNTSFLPNINHLTEAINNMSEKRVKEFMPATYPCVSPNDSVLYAVDTMNKSNRNILPVVDKGKLIGLISRIELLSIALKNLK